MKSNKKVPQPQQLFNTRQLNRNSKQERQGSQYNRENQVHYAKNTIQQNCNIKIIDFNQSEKKENIKNPCRTEIPKWFEDQCKVQKQVLRKPLTIEIDQNLKPRSYSAISTRKQWSPPLKQLDNNQKVESSELNILYFAYFVLDEKFNTFKPTLVPLKKENIEKCYQYLLNLSNLIHSISEYIQIINFQEFQNPSSKRKSRNIYLYYLIIYQIICNLLLVSLTVALNLKQYNFKSLINIRHMGNQLCYEERELRKGDCLPQIERKIRNAKKEIKKSIRKPIKLFEEFNPKTEILQKFINFHQDHLINVVDKFQFPKPGKDFMAAGLTHSFVNVVEITQYNPRDNNERKTQLLKNLKEDIKIQEDKSLFYVILDEFNEFYKQLCYEKCEKGDYTTLTPAQHNLSVTRVESSPTIPALKSIKSFNRTQSDNREKIKTFLSENECFISRRKLLNLLNEDHNLVQYIILSNATLFDILKSVLYQTYKEAINIVSSEDNLDNYIQNSLFFQQIIQHYIYDKALCIGKLIEIALSIYYQPNDFVLQFDAVSMEKPTFLDASLYPEPGQFTIIKEIDEDALINESCKFRQQEFYRSSSKASVIEMQYKIKKAVKEIEEQNIPYKELFKILQKIFEEVKPYRIFLHIQQLSDAIVQVYLQQRPQDQQDKYRELILAEDNKLSIILFLLQKFQEQSQCNLNRLYYKLRFMMDFDQVLDKRIKYEMDQSFVRFYACLEMITQTP